MFRDEKTGDYTDDKVLSTDAWNLYIKNADKLGRIMKEDYGLKMVLHPHGDSHIETPEDIDRIFQATDPEYVGFCLDTGHIVYGDGDPMELCRKYPERISYVHIKAMDQGLVKQAHDEDWPFVQGRRTPASRSPRPPGLPDMRDLIEALADLDKELYVVCEQDMYGCDPSPPPCPSPSRPASTWPRASASAPSPETAPSRRVTVRIGMIGPGGMGQAHIERIHTVIAGGRVVAVSDVDPARAAEVAERIGGGLRRHLGRAHREPRRRRRDDLQLRPGPRGRRAGVHRGRQAGALREAADPHRRRGAADHGGRAGRRPSPGHRRLHAPLRRAATAR